MASPNELDPVKLYAILADLLTRCNELSEIAVSPYVLPPLEPNAAPPSSSITADPSSSTATATLSAAQAASIYPFSLLEVDKLVTPQKPLYKAYAVAIKAFARYSRKEVEHTLASEASNDDSESATASKDKLAQLDALTRVILVQNPEHLRALNLRKKLILRKARVAHKMGHDIALQSTIEEELHLTCLILGIAANAKMATLWRHRKWLLSLLYQSEALQRRLYSIPSISLPQDILEQELKLVDQCATRYPRNYNAWAYRAWLIRGAYTEQNQVEWERMMKHLRINITDHTAVNHTLNTLLARTAGEGGRKKELVDLAHDLVKRYPYKETPWLLLRGAIIKLGDQQVLIDAEALATEVLAKARLDLEKYSAPEGEEESSWALEEAQKARKYARWTSYFLDTLGGAADRKAVDSPLGNIPTY